MNKYKCKTMNNSSTWKSNVIKKSMDMKQERQQNMNKCKNTQNNHMELANSRAKQTWQKWTVCHRGRSTYCIGKWPGLWWRNIPHKPWPNCRINWTDPARSEFSITSYSRSFWTAQNSSERSTNLTERRIKPSTSTCWAFKACAHPLEYAIART